jgi:hypothetical protein
MFLKNTVQCAAAEIKYNDLLVTDYFREKTYRNNENSLYDNSISKTIEQVLNSYRLITSSGCRLRLFHDFSCIYERNMY